MPGQTKPIVTKFDPCAVGMINRACEKQDRKIVLHTSWIRTGFWRIGVDGPGDVHDHCISEGINPDYFHEDLYCNRDIHWRYDRIGEWLKRHKEVEDFVILDDTPPNDDNWKKHLLLVNFEDGMTTKIFHKLLDGTFKV